MWRGNILDTTLRLVQILLGSPATNGTALEAYSEPFLTFKIGCFAKTVDGYKPWTIFTKRPILTLNVPIPDKVKFKIKLNFYFDTSLWCLKRLHEGLEGLHKPFWGTTKKCQNKNLTQFLSQYSFQKWTGL